MDSTTVAMITATAERLGMAGKEAFFWWLVSQQIGNILTFISVMVFFALAARFTRYAIELHNFAQDIERITGWDVSYRQGRSAVLDTLSKHVSKPRA